MTTWKRKVEEYEANLYTVQKTWWAKLFLRSKGGEMEAKRYEDGERRIEFDLHGVKVPDGARVSVMLDGRPVWEIEVQEGHARVRLSSADGEPIPQVQTGSKVEIRYMGETLLEGTFRPD